MAEKKIVWNLNKLEVLAGTLKTQTERLEEQYKYLQNIKDNVAANWESPAGTAYQERMDADLGDMDRLIKALNNDIQAIETAKSSFYRECESAVRKRLSQLGAGL